MARRLGQKRRPLSMEEAMRITIGFLFILTFTAFATFGIKIGELRILQQHSAEAQRSLALVEAYFEATIDGALGALWHETAAYENAAKAVGGKEAVAILSRESRHATSVLSRVEVFAKTGRPLGAFVVGTGTMEPASPESANTLFDEVRRRNAEAVACGSFIAEGGSAGPGTGAEPALVLGVPLRGPGGEFAGLVQGTMPLSAVQLSRLQREVGLKDGAAFFVIDAAGKYVVNPGLGWIGGKTGAAPPFSLVGSVSTPAGGTAGAGQNVITARGGQRLVVTYRPFSRFGWVFGMAVPERVLFAAVRELARQLFAAAVVALAFCLLAVGWVSRRLLLPLKGLEQAAQELSAGSFDLDLPQRGSREVQEVARALGAAAGELATKTAVLERESRRQATIVRRMAVLFEVSRQIISSLDLNEALAKVVEAATLVTPAETCSLMIYDEHADALRIQASQGLVSDSGRKAVFRKGEGLAGWVLSSGEALVVGDARNDPRFVTLAGQLEEIRSYACVPLRTRNGTNGVISMSSSKPDVFNDEDIQLLTLLANHSAIAIENAHLFRETQTRLEEVTALLEVSSSIASSLKLQETLVRVVSEAVRVTESAEKGTLLLLGEDGRLAIRAGYGYHDKSLVGLSVGPGEGYAYEVFRAGRPLIFNNLRENPLRERFMAANPSAAESAEVGSSIGVPVELGGKIIGVLGLDSSKTSAFAQPDLRLLSGLASQAAVAIERAELFERTRALYLSGVRTLVAAVDAKDPYTRGHSDNVAFYAKRMAQKLALPEEEVERIELAGLLHDIGKIGIADTILKKPGPLNREEREAMITHADLGAGILEGNGALASLIPFVKHHHEWYDGRGYPDGLGGGAIPLGAAIIAVADAFDTMTSDRPYRRSRGLEWALDEVRRCSGTQFRPEAAQALLSVIAEDEASGSPYVARLRKMDAGPA